MNVLKTYFLHFVYIIVIPVISFIFDFPIHFKIGKTFLLMPVSHRFPYFSKLYPEYSLNLGRLAKAIGAKYPTLTIIDIGANVGDSAAILRGQVDSRILSIDGSEKYFNYLKQNSEVVGKINTVKYFVGPKGKTGLFVEGRGTGRIIRKRGTIKTVSLEKILLDYPSYRNSKLIKIDTDGYDALVLKDSKEYLLRAKPVIFFEYFSDMESPGNKQIFEIFGYIQKLGYKKLVFYDNYGTYILSLDLANEDILRELHLYFSGGKKRYADISAFHKEDIDLFEKFRKSEIDYYQKIRNL